MAATTTLLGLVTPTQGTLSGTWGDTVNYGITDYVDISVAGTLTLTGDGAVTLANTTGSSSGNSITSTLAGAGTVTAQFSAVRVSGTTTTKVVTGPSYSKTYLLDNASSYAVTFKASGQTGVSISPGEKVYVYYNATDYVKVGGGGITYGAVKTTTYTAVSNDGVQTNTTGGAFTVNLPATPSTGTQVFIVDSAGTWGTNNLTIGRNGSTIAGSATDLVCDINSVSIQCIYDGTTWDIFAQIGANDTAVVTLNGTQTLTNKTLTAPVLTAPVLGTPASGTVTNLTGTASININGTVGATTANTGAFTTLSASSTVSGTGFSTYLASPPAIGATTPTTGTFNALTIKTTASTGLVFNDTIADRWQFVNRNDAGDVFQIVSGNLNSGGSPIANLTSEGFAFGNIGLGFTTPTTSGTGITFPATQSASSDANTLDDYEEGTWTPSLGGTTIYSGQSGTYTKVGRLVFIRGILVITTIGTGSTTVISGLPFTNASGQVSPVSVGSFFTSATAVSSFFVRISNGGSTIDVGSLVVAGTTEGSNAIFTNNTQFQFSGCYIV